MTGRAYDAVVVGSGPNGLAAAIALSRAGHSVLVVEAAQTIGGGMRSAELTRAGFTHDVCSAIHPMALASPFFQQLPLHEHGLKWIQPSIPLAHPLDRGECALLSRSVDETADNLDGDVRAYRRLMTPLVNAAPTLFQELIGPFRIPRHPFFALRFAWRGVRSTTGLTRHYFRNEKAKALMAGLAAHSMLPLEKVPSAAIGLVLGVAGHAVGWPMPRGGTQSLANALAALFQKSGGEIVVGTTVGSLSELPPARAILLDLTPRQVLAVAGDRLPRSYLQRLRRYRYGMGVFKMDWALRGPIPWSNDRCRLAGTVHIGGRLEEIAAAERVAWEGGHPERPFVLLAQPTLFDPSRAPVGAHVAWGYCHVPNGSTFDMSQRIEAQIERFAPGFRDLILARHAMNAPAMEQYNMNYIGGDINGGVSDLRQLFSRPVLSLNPYRTPLPGLYLCSSSTPPGGGVHGLCGFFAAQAALKYTLHASK